MRTEVQAIITEVELKEKHGSLKTWVESITTNHSFSYIGECADKEAAQRTAYDCSTDIGICSYTESEYDVSKRISELESQEDSVMEALKSVDKRRWDGEGGLELDKLEDELNQQAAAIEIAMNIEWQKLEKQTKSYVLIADY
ncbi:hypothetical protein BCT63_02905 [Vibrio kanaloae]|uniref:hypothetical protein n=1 Tax=Vibrio TaxID=662 RepID=UPI000C848C3B|nr:hypothetical protein [Vibrio kanaloae]MBM5436492.1 hypothetical protein [Vibrio parahaemolyticus]MBM5438467.1 hypothetical protein [Vibrio parahaemolyticus]MCF9752929.1 hypothetical protein [Vibrio parahaemolyticus]MCF9759510.1 hypothetical protein [Vibrio parahaemolyticus]MCF9785403.1 hypothetical protein [Vibrio parahaemolyticus]